MIEGFYGQPWTRAERLDLHHRAIWREPYPGNMASGIGALVGACAERGRRFVYGIGPGLDIVYGDGGEIERLCARFEQMLALGCRHFSLMVPGSINHSDDELAFLSYYPLLRYEDDPALVEVYRQSLTRSWLIERPERNPLWNFIFAVGTGAKEFDAPESLRTLREIPMDQIQWTVRNSHRLDVPVDPIADRHKRRQALVVLPYDELPMSKWNGNPYSLDGGDGGRSEDDGAYFLLPYWMGRYHGLVATESKD